MTDIRSVYDYEDYLDKLEAYEKQERGFKKALQMKPRIIWIAFLSACIFLVLIFGAGSMLRG